MKAVKTALEGALLGRKSRFTAARQTSQGERQWFDVVVSPLNAPLNGAPLVLAVSRDVTEQHLLEEKLLKAKEEAELSARARSDFVATMSHELRTPLAAVLSHLDLIDMARIAPDDARRLQRIHEASGALLRIINDVLDIASIEADGLPLIVQPFDIVTLAEDVLFLLAPLARAKGLRFTLQVDRESPTRLQGDSGRLRQVIVNLASNAVKFTATGSVVLGIAIQPKRGGRAAVAITVSDTGIGISSDTRDMMYTRFAQLDPGIKGRYGGTGLGLAISRHIVERMGGTLDVDSEPGRGTTFTIGMELKVADPLPSSGTEAGSPASRGSAAFDLSVLVADDNELHREVTAELLVAMGCRVETAADGLAAIDAVKRQAFDVLLLDEQMPGLNGSEAARRIRRLRRLRAMPRIVICTANVFGGLAENATVDECLVKPLTRANLARVLGRVGNKLPAPAAGEWLPREAVAAHLNQFRLELEDLDARIDVAPRHETAPKAHRLISSAAILGFEALCLALQHAESALLWPESASAVREIDDLRREMATTLSILKADAAHA